MKRFLFALIPSALAATVFDCVPFEPPSSNNDIYLKISNKEVDSSVLIYSVKYIIGTNIPYQDITDEFLEARNDDFGICTEELKSEGACETVGEYVIKYRNKITNKENNIYNAFLKAGEDYTYRIKERGVYCIAAHQETETVKGLVLKSHHSYGKLPYEKYFDIYTTFATAVFESFMLFIMRYSSKAIDLVPYSMILSFSLVSLFTHMIKIASLYILNEHNAPSFKWADSLLNLTLESCKSIVVWIVLFGASLNKPMLFNFTKGLQLIKSNGKFKILFFTYVILKFIQIFLELWKPIFKVLDLPFPFTFNAILQISSYLLWIPMFSIINKNYKSTLNELNFDATMKIYARKYRLSKEIMIAIPLIVNSAPIFYMYGAIFVEFRQISNLASLSILDAFKIMSVACSDGIYTYPALIFLNIIDNSLALICFVLSVIWKPFKKSNLQLLEDTIVDDVKSAKNGKLGIE